MKKISTEKEREIREVIEGDRLNLAFRSAEIIKNDVASVIKEYFTVFGEPTVKIREEKGKYKITIAAVCKKD